MDVGDWLRNQNLGKYEEAFRENAIDLDVLPDLTDGDLAQIGVALGDRKRLLKAIASFPPSEPISPAEGSAPRRAPAEWAKPAPVSSAERRPITVMFCDLVGSTTLAAKLDAEDWRELVGEPGFSIRTARELGYVSEIEAKLVQAHRLLGVPER